MLLFLLPLSCIAAMISPFYGCAMLIVANIAQALLKAKY